MFEGSAWIHLAQETEQYPVLVNMSNETWGSIKRGEICD
jgi:hypothetical protein